MSSIEAIVAKQLAVLIDHDGPQLVLLQSAVGKKLLAVAIFSATDDEFFVCEAKDKDFDRYLAGTVDLRYVFQNTVRGRYFLYGAKDFDAQSHTVKLRSATKEQSANQAFFPQHGLFSRSHTVEYLHEKTGKATIDQTYKIDGQWEASDFSKFYGKMADLYAFFSLFEHNWASLPIAARTSVSTIVRSKNYQGGGSYLGLYDQLSSSLLRTFVVPLKLSRISYASPGQVVFKGDQIALASIETSVSKFQNNQKEVKRLYDSIRGTLSREKLLKGAPSSSFRSEPLQKRIRLEADTLSGMLGIQNHQALYEASDKNTLVYSKIVLSIYRRVREVSAFRDEGRISA